jgi:pyruvyl transferase EpsI
MFLSKYISFENKSRILLFLQKFDNQNFFRALEKNTNKKVYIFLAADYGNLGDVAITFAQTQFLKNTLVDYEIIDVPISKTLAGIAKIKQIIQLHDIVTTVGGGNFGDLYDQIEFYRQLIVESFPENKVVSFPQTMDFSDKKKGRNALLVATKTYSKHKNMTFVAREKVSFEMMRKNFPKNNVILTPDIVISLDMVSPEFKREGVVLCLRADEEKLLKKAEQDILLKLVDKNFDSITYYDTHVNKNHLNLKERLEELNKIWNQFKKSELVITDRLHGMIFCYITKTPCLVFQNNNHKVKGSYEWIKNQSNIKLIDKFSANEIENFLSSKSYLNLKHESLNGGYEILSTILIK